MYETEKILAGITESHTTSDTGFIIRSGPRHVKCNHTLILVPDINHAVQFLILRLYRIFGKKIFPCIIQMFQCVCHLGIRLIFAEQCFRRSFVDHIWCLKFFFHRILTISENEDQWSAFARSQCDIDLVGTDRIPSACDRICRFSVFYGFRIGNTSVSTEEIVAACVEAINVCVDRINGVMITAFAVFCFMIDRRTDYFYFSDI